MSAPTFVSQQIVKGSSSEDNSVRVKRGDIGMPNVAASSLAQLH